MLLRYMSSKPSDPPGVQVCTTKACTDLASRLPVDIIRSLGICENFGSHVYYPMNKNNARTKHQSLQDTWVYETADIFQRGTNTLSATHKAAAMFRSCIDRKGQDVDQSLLVLQDFMKMLRLPWPDDPSLDQEPFDVLLNLAINWQLPLWFQVKLADTTGDGPRRVWMVPLAKSLLFSNDFDEVRNSESFRQRWMLYSKLLFRHSSKADQTSRITRCLELHNNVSRLLHRFAAGINRKPQNFSFRKTNEVTKVVTSAKLIGILNKHLKVLPELDEDDEFVTSDAVALQDIFNILTLYDHKDILDYLGWSVVQASGVGGFGQPSEKLPLATDFLLLPNLYCVAQVEDVYRLLMASEQTISWHTLEGRRKLHFLFNDILHKAASTLSNATSIEEGVRTAAVYKLKRTTLKLWPSDGYLADKALKNIYLNFPENEDSHIKYWVWSRGNASKMVTRNVYFEIMSLPHFLYDQPLFYDSVQNRVLMSMSILSRPLYYEGGTIAMLYGGLGVIFATQIVRAVNLFLTQLHARTSPSCMDASNRTILARTALELAYSAFEDVARLKGDLRLGGLPHYSENQLFFIIWCYLTRSLMEFGGTTDCDSVLENFRPFKIAFHCYNDTEVSRGNSSVLKEYISIA